MSLTAPGPSWRFEVTEGDIGAIRDLVAATGVFSPAEIDIAAELVEERLKRGDASGYHFVLADRAEGLLGYACYGLIAGTESSFDLYWIAVARDRQGHGLGQAILARAEEAMSAQGATRYYAETSSTDAYAATRAFYQRAGFQEVAHIADFYRPGDGKVIYLRVL